MLGVGQGQGECAGWKELQLQMGNERVQGLGAGLGRAGAREQSCMQRVTLITVEATGKHWGV